MREQKDPSLGTWCSADWHSKTGDPIHLLCHERDSGSKNSPPHVSGPRSPRRKALPLSDTGVCGVCHSPGWNHIAAESAGDLSSDSFSKRKATAGSLQTATAP